MPILLATDLGLVLPFGQAFGLSLGLLQNPSNSVVNGMVFAKNLKEKSFKE